MELSETFDAVAELYDRARPRYPAELYDELGRLTGLRAGARVLEIAPATGIATVELARRGFEVAAVEMGANLAAVARKNLARWPAARVEVARFEEWAAPEGQPFDLVCCATAFTWLEAATRLDRCAALLRRGGYLAVWDTLHVEGGTSEFFVDVQQCYERWMPGTEPGLRLTPASAFPNDPYGIGAHPEFHVLAVRDFPVEISYSSDEYIDVLRTYSNHIALEAANAEGLYQCVRELIESRYNGRITKAYVFRLLVAGRG